MPRLCPHTILIVAMRHAAGSHSVPRPPQRTLWPRQGPAYGKNPQVPHPRCPCQAHRGEDRSARRGDVGNQQRQCVIGGEPISCPWRTLYRPCWRHGRGVPLLPLVLIVEGTVLLVLVSILTRVIQFEDVFFLQGVVASRESTGRGGALPRGDGSKTG